MTDRKYVKLNTSIQTASNTQGLNDNNKDLIPAKIELRLPDNIFKANNGNQHIDTVSMLVTKMRLSMSDTPLASAIIEEQDSEKIVTTAQMDVYPFCFVDGSLSIQPNPNDSRFCSALPFYKNHFIEFKIVYHPDIYTSYLVDDFKCIINGLSTGKFPNNRFNNMINDIDIIKDLQHMMNIVVPIGHTNYSIEENTLMIKDLGSIEQMVADGFENAITFASTEDNIIVQINLKNITAEEAAAIENKNLVVQLAEFNNEYALYDNYSILNHTFENHLVNQCKPKVQLTEQTFQISYDTCTFDPIVPILWDSSNVPNYDKPLQFLDDMIRENALYKQPAKRVYKYDIKYDETDETYEYTIPNLQICAPVNLIGNKALTNIFPFLPWVEIDLKKYVEFNNINFQYQNEVYDTTRIVEVHNDILHLSKSVNGVLKYFDTWMKTQHNNYRRKFTFYVLKSVLVENEEAYKNISNWQNVSILDDGILIKPAATAQNISDNVLAIVIDGNTNIFSSTNVVNTYNSNYPALDSNISPVEISNRNLHTENSNEQLLSSAFGQVLFLNEENGQFDDLGQLLQLSQLDSSSNSHIVDIDSEAKYQVRAFKVFVPSKKNGVFVKDETYESDVYDKYEVYYEYGHHEDSYPFIRLFYGYEDNLADEDQYISSIFSTDVKTDTNDKCYIKSTEVNPPPISDLVYPNMILDDNKVFYMLDGNTQELSCSSLEVVDTRSFLFDCIDYSIDEYKGTLTTTVATYSNPTINDTTPGKIIQDLYYLNGSYELFFGEYYEEILTWDDVALPQPDDETNPMTWLIAVEPQTLADGMIITIYFGSTKNPSSYIGSEEYDATNVNTTIIPNFDHSFENIEQAYSSNNPLLSVGSGTPKLIEQTDLPDDYHMSTTFNDYTWKNHFFVYTNWATKAATWSIGMDKYSSYNSVHYSGDDVKGMLPTVNATVTKTLSDNRKVKIWYIGINRSETQNGSNYALIKQYSNVTIRILDDGELSKYVRTDVDSYHEPEFAGNIRLNFKWDNLPIVVMSPIQSIVLSLTGMQVTEEIQPINISNQLTGSNLVSTFPIIENYYSLATSIRDLHDELVIIKDSFDDNALYSLPNFAGQERTINLAAYYITKDGSLHQIYIPKNGVFNLQLTFGISYYYN